ncbi:pectinesterase, catalytic [Artemisia annua]|uniref:Pectinesterase n=1 Tax=Artemisia annua TaxID=35608 RepID=A0A2U1MDQ9_ARTAN|nr:pectinesterase, catalytic [Artemisia annua]
MTAFPLAATFIIYCLFFCLSPDEVHGYTMIEIRSWCSQTPHPDTCVNVLANKPNLGPMKQKPDFINALLKVTLEQATDAESNTKGLGPKCRNNLEKAAWNDCVQLYAYTVERINMTVDPHKKCSQVEMQTWLSAALTNLETCKSGFEELGVGGAMLPLMNNNVSSLLSNTLAMNNGGPSTSFEPNYEYDFPTWVKPSDRKLLQSSNPASGANAIVAQDGSGTHTTIASALASAKSGGGRYVIYVKAGTYNEYIDVKANNIFIRGDGIGKTVITGSKSYVGGSTTYGSSTMGVDGDGFMGQGFTVRNTAGPQKQQAVALRCSSDLSVFYQCSFEGYQDTLYISSNRQFYQQCNIYGTVDFIFGNAAAVLQNCNIYARDPPNKTITLTAQARTDPNQNTGISIQNCRVMAASNLNGVKTYLGRPWRQYSRTVFLKTYLDGIVNPAGWLPWSGNFALNTLYYGEYMNTGPGSSTADRVKWKGYHVITSAAEAGKFTPGNFIAGGSWIPKTGVPCTLGL